MGWASSDLMQRMDSFYARQGFPVKQQGRAGLTSRVAANNTTPTELTSERALFKDVALEILGLFTAARNNSSALGTKQYNRLYIPLRKAIAEDDTVKFPKSFRRIDKYDFISSLMNDGLIPYLLNPEQEFPSHGQYEEDFYKSLTKSPEGIKILNLINESIKKTLIDLNNEERQDDWKVKIPDNYSFIQIPETTNNLSLPSSSNSQSNAQIQNQASNPKRLLLGVIRLAAVGVVAAGVGGVLEFTGKIDVLKGVVGPDKGGTPPPAQIVGNEALKKITDFPGDNLSGTSERDLRAIISKNFTKIEALDLKSYYGGTSKAVSQNGKTIGIQIQVDIETADGLKPHVLVAQRNKDGIQFTLIQVEEAKANPLRQVGDKVIVITMLAGNAPKVKTLSGSLESLGF
jgi:hypothetical protein